MIRGPSRELGSSFLAASNVIFLCNGRLKGCIRDFVLGSYGMTSSSRFYSSSYVFVFVCRNLLHVPVCFIFLPPCPFLSTLAPWYPRFLLLLLSLPFLCISIHYNLLVLLAPTLRTLSQCRYQHLHASLRIGFEVWCVTQFLDICGEILGREL